MAAAAAAATNGDIPEDANESMSSQKISETILEKHTQKIAMAAAAAATNDDIPEDANENCPGPQAESAGKADACAGCPNQEICAPAPKGPDRGEMPRGAGDYHPIASIRRRYDAERERVRAARLKQLERDNPTAHALFTDEIHPAAVPDDDDGGPYDTTLLRSFSNHIARKIWDDPTNARGVLDSKYHYNTLHRNWPIRELLKDVAQMVYSTSFKTIVNYSYEHIDMALVSAFVERWQPETNTFHLPFGEMTITLDDVKQILDMPVMGTPLHLAPGSKWPDNDDEEIDWSSLMSKGIGVQGDTDYKALHGDGDCIKMSKLREYFINTNLTDAQKSSHAYKLKEFRAWMVYMCGSLVFPNKSGGKVNAKLMYYVMHPDHVDDYAWGVAILAFLYRELGKASRASCAQIAGCLPLLLCWIWEHFPNLKRPTWDSRYLENEPRLKRWLPTQNPGSHHESLIAYRHEIDEMDKDDVIWDPYKEQRADSRPLAHEAWYAGLLVYLDILEAYYPDRVLRQFGLVQTIPRMPYNAPINATRGRRGRYELSYRFLVDQLVNWPTHVLAVPSRSTPSEYQSEVDPGYMEWFYTFSHPRVHRGELRSRLPMPDRGSEEEMHTMAVAMKRARTSMANMKDADTNTGSGKAKRTLNKLGKLFGFACEGNMVNTHKHLKDMEDTRRYY